MGSMTTSDEMPERVPGSVWCRHIYDLLPDCHECRPNCEVGHKAMNWRPPTEHESVYYWFTYDAMCVWKGRYPSVPRFDHDFTKGPEYPSQLPDAERPTLA
jgi:hypothetical protein